MNRHKADKKIHKTHIGVDLNVTLGARAGFRMDARVGERGGAIDRRGNESQTRAPLPLFLNQVRNCSLASFRLYGALCGVGWNTISWCVREQALEVASSDLC